MGTTEELLEEILQARIEFVLVGDVGGDSVMASEATDVTEEVGTAFLALEEMEEEAIETGKASSSGSDFDWNNLFDTND